MSIIEQVVTDRTINTPEDMRKELFRLRLHDPLVRRVFDVANMDGLSAEDKYTMLAYYAMADRNRFQQLLVDDAMTRPRQFFIETPLDCIGVDISAGIIATGKTDK